MTVKTLSAKRCCAALLRKVAGRLAGEKSDLAREGCDCDEGAMRAAAAAAATLASVPADSPLAAPTIAARDALLDRAN